MEKEKMSEEVPFKENPTYGEFERVDFGAISHNPNKIIRKIGYGSFDSRKYTESLQDLVRAKKTVPGVK